MSIIEIKNIWGGGKAGVFLYLEEPVALCPEQLNSLDNYWHLVRLKYF